MHKFIKIIVPSICIALLLPLGVAGASSTFNATAYNHVGLSDPTAITSHGKYIWVANRTPSNKGDVIRVTAATGAHLTIASPLLTNPDGLVSDGTYVWVLNQASYGHPHASIVRIDIATSKVTLVAHLGVYGWPPALTIAGPYLWEADGATGSLFRINRATLAVTARTSDLFTGAAALAADSHYLWVARDIGGPLGRGSLTRVSLATGALVSVNSPYFNDPVTVTSNGTYVWMPASNHVVVRVDIATNKVVKISSKAFNTPLSIASTANYTYVASVDGITPPGGDVVRISSKTDAVNVITSPLLTGPIGVTTLGSSAWVIDSSLPPSGATTNNLLVRLTP